MSGCVPACFTDGRKVTIAEHAGTVRVDLDSYTSTHLTPSEARRCAYGLLRAARRIEARS